MSLPKEVFPLTHPPLLSCKEVVRECAECKVELEADQPNQGLCGICQYREDHPEEELAYPHLTDQGYQRSFND